LHLVTFPHVIAISMSGRNALRRREMRKHA
jgi:hypothetical protein